MYELLLSEDQMQKIRGMLDMALKVNGLVVLQDVVDLFNAINNAKEVVEEKTNDEVQF